MLRPARSVSAVASLASVLLLAACATESTPSSAGSSSSATSADACAASTLRLVTPGTLTIGTDKPAYPPYFVDDTPNNGKGFESAVAYAVASRMGFTKDQVKWTVVPFDSSYAPGEKKFDFDINQISITDKRKAAVDFSTPYFTVPQAVLTLNTSKFANATSIADLKDAKLGAQVGTTSLAFINNTIAPTQQAQVFNDTAGAKSSLSNGTLDAIVVDLPTAFYISAAEIDGSKVVGQFAVDPSADTWGLLFGKGSPLVGCANQALAQLASSGDLAKITAQWLSTDVKVPVLQ